MDQKKATLPKQKVRPELVYVWFVYLICSLFISTPLFLTLLIGSGIKKIVFDNAATIKYWEVKFIDLWINVHVCKIETERTAIFSERAERHLFFQELLELRVGIFDRNSELMIADQKLVDNRQKSNIHHTCSKHSRGN